MPTKRTSCNRCFKESNILGNWSKAFSFLFQVVPTSKIEISSPGGFKFQSKLKIWRMEVRTKCVCRHKFVFLSYFISTIWKEEYTLVRFLDVSELFYLIQFIFLYFFLFFKVAIICHALCSMAKATEVLQSFPVWNSQSSGKITFQFLLCNSSFIPLL